MKLTPIAVLVAAATFSAAQDPPPGGAVEGTVVNSVTGAGISGASVTLLGSGSVHYATKSDAAGRFKITGMSAGDYRAVAHKDGFAPPDLRSLLHSGLHVTSATDAVKVELKLTPFDAIQGRVLDPDGKPFAGVEVILNPDITADSAVTDQEGRFALANLRPGSFLLIAKPKRVQPKQASNGTRTAIVSTYYPSATDPSVAQQIVLRGEGDSSDYEIRMKTATVYRVRGTVTNEEGKPWPAAEIGLYSIPEATPEPMELSQRMEGFSIFAIGLRRALAGAAVSSATADKNGQFEFPAVQSGNWRIINRPELDAPMRGLADVFVGLSDVEDVQVHYTTPFNLTGTIERKDGNPGSPHANGETFLINPDTNEFVRGGRVESESDGLWFGSILPGRYKVIFKPGLSGQVFLGENEAIGQTLPVTADGPQLRIVLKASAGTVRGTVEKGDGATVVLIPQRIDGVALGQTMICGTGGSFELSEVSPGDYYIAAFDHMNGFSPSAAMLSLVPSRGIGVKVEEGTAKDVTLSAIATPR